MTLETELMAIAAKQGLLRARDLAVHGIPREVLRRLTQAGRLTRLSRGVYAHPSGAITEHHSLAEASLLAPNGVICLLSALRFHKLTTQAPFEVWMAIANKAWKPQAGSVSIRFVRFSGAALTQGIEKHDVEGKEIQVYSAAKTVADCFKFRNKIGIDVAMEALRDCVSTRVATIDEIERYAVVCRVANVMRPYMEMLSI